MFEINFLPIISGARNDSFPAAWCIHKPVINEIGSRSRDAGFPEEAAWAQLGRPCGTHCDCLRGRGLPRSRHLCLARRPGKCSHV